MTGPDDLERFRQTLREQLPRLAHRFGVAELSLFGSYVRREARPDSDLDVLVRFHESPGLLRFIELENDLSDLLGVRVDLVMPDALKPHIGQRILEEAIPV